MNKDGVFLVVLLGLLLAWVAGRPPEVPPAPKAPVVIPTKPEPCPPDKP